MSFNFRLVLVAAALMSGMSAIAQAHSFIHPGALDSLEEFGEIERAVRAGRDPWTADFSRMRANSHDSPDYAPRPVSVLVRGTAPGHLPENYANLFNDTAAAYALALDWRISGDEKRGARAAQILTAWARTLTAITGTSDRYLASGIYGYQLAVAGETLYGFPGWTAADQDALKQMLLTVFAPMNSDFLVRHNGAKTDHYWANWDLANTASLMAIGVFTDRRDLYEQARNYYLHGAGNGVILTAAWKLHPGGLAQWQESGRDQPHTMLGIGFAGSICLIAQHQGDDLFAAYDSRLLAAARYVARYNMGIDVPYTPYSNSDVTQPVISDKGRGEMRPIWALFYGHYVQRRGLTVPEIAQMMTRVGLEGGGGDYGPNSGGFDQLGYGSLTFIKP
jgi:hypothetical protein